MTVIGCEGIPPLTARTEPWMEVALAQPDECADLIARWGSPLNLHDFTALARNANELKRVAASHGTAFAIFLARKANKTRGLVREARDLGLGLDVASRRELQQALDDGLPGDRLVFSAATKTPAALRLALESGTCISLDNRDEADLVQQLARDSGTKARVALRLAVMDERVPPTRFGMSAAAWVEYLSRDDSGWLAIAGVHFHLNGYEALHRAIALVQSCVLADTLSGLGHHPTFVDMGGGFPMSYLDDPAQWRAFWRMLAETTDPAGSSDSEKNVLPPTWRGDRLGMENPEADRPSPQTYPYYQRVTRGEWLDAVLATSVREAAGSKDFRALPTGQADSTIANLLNQRGLELRCEPGRAMLDGCGMTIAEVAFQKQTSDGVGLVGLYMNRTAMRSTSADYLVDPRLIRPSTAMTPRQCERAFFVGSYCIEEELIMRRAFTFPDGVARGDIVAFPNTGGYLMHILESASHQLPLAANLVRTESGWSLDEGDRDHIAGGESLDRSF